MTIESVIARAVADEVGRRLEEMESRIIAQLREREAGPVSVAEAARRLGICERTVRRKILTGELRTVEAAGITRVVI